MSIVTQSKGVFYINLNSDSQNIQQIIPRASSYLLQVTFLSISCSHEDSE